MFQKVLILVLSLFLTSSPDSRILSCAAAVALFAVISTSFRAFNDDYEDLMDMISQCTNLLNIFLAFLLSRGQVDDMPASGFLFTYNGIAILIFLASLVAAPAYTAVDMRRKARKENALRERHHIAQMKAQNYRKSQRSFYASNKSLLPSP